MNAGHEERATWQAQKSAATRTQVLDAAISCFVEHGYANTTTTKIAQKAGLSRGAMLHHFPTKRDVVKAAVNHLHARRLRAYRRSVANLPPGEDRLKASLAVYWKQVTHPLFLAFLELKLAARTDKNLARILAPAQEAFMQEWYTTSLELYPEWRGNPDALQLALDLTQNLLDGMAINLRNNRPDETTDRMLAFAEEQLTALRPGSA